MKLSIVIPAYNEEKAIGATIERTLAAREAICRAGCPPPTGAPGAAERMDPPGRSGEAVTDVEVIVVSDGSTDRTVEIARTFRDVRLIVFEKNRGYGAAIKKGFAAATGELVGFLDADGTCNPRFFARLCDELLAANASVAIGSRLGPQSRMPRVRRIGNRVYALILSALSNKVVTDTASGMRVIRRDALPRLYPLPDGLHFTPAMSARILMDEQLSIVECPMPYEERVGESKLNVFRDGMRFMRTILEMALRWQPAKMFVAASVLCLAIMFALLFYPAETWLRVGQLREDMIYRLLFCCLIGAVALSLLSAGVVCGQLDRQWKIRRPPTFASLVMERVFSMRCFAVATVATAPMLLWLVGPAVWSRIASGSIELHWSRVVLAGLIVFGLGQLLITAFVANVIRFHVDRGTMSAARKESSESAVVGLLTSAERARETVRPNNPPIPRPSPATMRRAAVPIPAAG